MFPAGHRPAAARRMIGMAEEMKDPVHQAESKFVRRALPETNGLLHRPFHGNGHIAEKTGGRIPLSPGRRKRQYVGRAIPLQETSILNSNPFVAGKKQTHFSFESALLPQNEIGQIADGAQIQRADLLLVPDLDPGHRELEVISNQ